MIGITAAAETFADEDQLPVDRASATMKAEHAQAARVQLTTRQAPSAI